MENIGVIELSSNEIMAIDGGKPIGYYLGFALGAIAGTVVSLFDGIKDGLDGQHK